jgi:hypothetical protein
MGITALEDFTQHERRAGYPTADPRIDAGKQVGLPLRLMSLQKRHADMRHMTTSTHLVLVTVGFGFGEQGFNKSK